MRDALIGVATLLGAVVTICVALGTLSRLRPIRWLWRTLVGNPLARWFRAEVREVVIEELAPVKRQLDAVDHAVNRVSPGEPRLIEMVREHRVQLARGEEHFEHLDRGQQELRTGQAETTRAVAQLTAAIVERQRHDDEQGS